MAEKKEKGPSYITMLNNAWATMPALDGYKPSYLFLFMTIIYFVNRNFWKSTPIEYTDILIRSGISKKTFLNGRVWLSDHKFIDFDPGRNRQVMARYNIPEVSRETAGRTAEETAGLFQAVTEGTAGETHLIKTKDINTNKTKDILFEQVWEMYKYKLDKIDAEKAWKKLTPEEKEKALQEIPQYVLRTQHDQYRFKLKNYLKGKIFNNEKTEQNGNYNHGTTGKIKHLTHRTVQEYEAAGL